MQISPAETLSDLSPRLRDPYFVRTLRLAVIISLVMSAVAGVAYPFLQPVVPLFYSVSQPEQQLAHKLWIFLLPALAWLITFFHFILLKNLKELSGTIEKLFCWTTVGVVFILGMLLVRIIFLVL